MSFFLELAAKDVRLACEMGRENKVPMDMANIIEQKVIESIISKSKTNVIKLNEDQYKKLEVKTFDIKDTKK